MYFDQYFIKPAFATLTSLLRTYRQYLAVAFLYIFRCWFQPVFFVQPSVFACFNLFCLLSATSAALAFLPFLSVGSAKVGIFFLTSK